MVDHNQLKKLNIHIWDSLLLLQAWVHIHFLLFRTSSSSCTQDYYNLIHLQNHVANHAGRETLCLHSFLVKNMLHRACVRGFRNCSLFLLILFHHQFDSLLTAILIVIFLKEIASSAYVVCVIYVWSNLRMASHVQFFRSACNHIFHSNCWLKKKLTCPICCV